MSFGQVVIGPPGSGKTTYCDGMQQFMTQLGRKVIIVNLDPANDYIPYKCAINVSELTTVEAVMQEHNLGPNGALMFCMEVLEKNVEWLTNKLEQYEGHYVLFDCPGQVELYSHHQSISNIVQHLQQEKDYRLTSVNLIDSFYCTSPTNYISACLLSLSMMLRIELPHVNVLSKIDMMKNFGKLDFNLEFYTNAGNLGFLMEHVKGTAIAERYKKLNSAICTVVEDFSLVSFMTLDIQDKESTLRVLRMVDKANGYVFASMDATQADMMELVATPDPFEAFRSMEIQDKYLDDDNEP